MSSEIETVHPSVVTQVSSTTRMQDNCVLLATAIIYLRDDHGQVIRCRALLDSGSQSNFITRECANLLKATRNKIHATVCGLSNELIDIKSSLRVTIANEGHNFEKNLQFLIIKKYQV